METAKVARARLNREIEPHRADCGYCYGNGCFVCGNRGWAETEAGREAREEHKDGAYDRWRDDLMMGEGL